MVISKYWSEMFGEMMGVGEGILPPITFDF
jgi:hypothetical protein